MKELLICPNAFKGALSAGEAATAIRRGLERSGISWSFVELPIADGGDGSLFVLSSYLKTEIRHGVVNDPLGRPAKAAYGWNAKKDVAIVELAEASGLAQLKGQTPNPMRATSFGTGELLDEVIRLGAKRIYLAVGGSATVDGAVGILNALGVRFYAGDERFEPNPESLQRITSFDAADVILRLEDVELLVLCDVENPLLGPEGAATVFGPQKGAGEDEVNLLESGLAHWSRIIKKQTTLETGNIKHGGAAGGIAGVLYGVLNAKLLAGGEKILELAGFHKALDSCDLVITGEGRIDQQTGFGKGPGLVAKKAKERGKFVMGLSGSVGVEDIAVPYFDVVLPICNGPVSFGEAISNTSQNLERTAFQIGRLIASQT